MQDGDKKKQLQKADSIPATEETSTIPDAPASEEWRAQLQGIKNSIEALTNTLSGHANEAANDLEQFKTQLRKVGDTVLTNNQQTFEEMQKTLDGSVEAYITMQKNLDARDEEIKRLKSGYGAKIFRDFLRYFIRIGETARELMQTADKLNEDVRKDVCMICDLLEDALEYCSVTRFSPQIGEDYRKTFGIADKLKIVSTDDACKDWQVTETLSEGYALQGHPDGNQEVVVKAKVKIFRHQKEG